MFEVAFQMFGMIFVKFQMLWSLCMVHMWQQNTHTEKNLIGTEKTMTAWHDRNLRFFLRPECGQFSPHFGAISSLNYTVSLEKREKNIHWRKFEKSSGDETLSETLSEADFSLRPLRLVAPNRVAP